MKNYIEGNILMKAHLNNNEPLSSCVEFLKTNMSVDQKNNYGQLERLKKGIISVKEANKLIQKRYHLENNNGSFIIPDKCYAFQVDCTMVSEVFDCINMVDLLATSIPYFQLREYDSELECQVGQEETKEKFRNRIPWNAGKKGLQSHTEEHKKKMSEKFKGNKFNVGRKHMNDGQKNYSVTEKDILEKGLLNLVPGRLKVGA